MGWSRARLTLPRRCPSARDCGSDDAVEAAASTRLGLLALVLAAMPLGLGCGSGVAATAVMPHGGHDPTPLARCSVAASQEQPLVTEWPAPYKARLEALLQQGAVAVSYSGCDLRLLDDCKLPGAYVWKKTTLSTDTTVIRDEDELYAKLPLGAAALSAELSTAGTLEVQTTVAGQLQLGGEGTESATAGAECPGATHLVRALSVGAFKLFAGGTVKGQAGAEVGNIGVHGGGSEHKSILRQAGDPATCRHTTAAVPSADCNSPIQIFLTPIRRSVPLNVLSPLPDEHD
jgi:hypothetical protein